VTQEPSFKFFPDLRGIHGRVTRRTARQAMPEMEADPETRAAGDTPDSGALLLAAARLADSADAGFPVQEPAPVVDS